ncbi:MAG TPA: translation initiation factor IF-2 N-terminal domain-containing protein, partial [Gemmatales bacterium]|nr:translation initiation factor IF-2 N-terminal domain-containing protein [Gemmatales bacterium]
MTTTKEPKVRIYQLAKDLDVDTAILLEICTEAGFDKVRSQLSSVDQEQIETIKKALKGKSAPPPPQVTPPPPPPVLKQPIAAKPPTLAPKPSTIKPATHEDIPPPVEEETVPTSAVVEPESVAPVTTPPKTLLPSDFKSRIHNLNQVRTIRPRQQPAAPASPTSSAQQSTPPATAEAPVTPAPSIPTETASPPAEVKPVAPGTMPAASKPVPGPETAPVITNKPVQTIARPIRPLPANNPPKPPNLPSGGPSSTQAPSGGEKRSAVDRARPTSAYSPPGQAQRRKIVMPGTAQAAPSSQPGVMKPAVKFTPDMLAGINTTKGPVTAKDIIRKIEEKHLEDKAKARREAGVDDLDEDDDKLRPGQVKGREERHKKRSIRAKARED